VGDIDTAIWADGDALWGTQPRQIRWTTVTAKARGACASKPRDNPVGRHLPDHLRLGDVHATVRPQRNPSRGKELRLGRGAAIPAAAGETASRPRPRHGCDNPVWSHLADARRGRFGDVQTAVWPGRQVEGAHLRA